MSIEAVVERGYGSRGKELSIQHARAVERYHLLSSVAPEALEYDSVTDPDTTHACAQQLELLLDAQRGETETYAQQHNRGAEEASRTLELFLEAKKNMFYVYMKAARESTGVAEIIVGENPWILGLLYAVQDQTHS